MKRRKALKHLGLGLSGGVLMPSIFSSCQREKIISNINYDGTVAIIGAGACGLYLADILKALGIIVNVYEAGSQVGGRVKSLNFQSVDKYPNSVEMISDFPIELGNQIVDGSNSIFGNITRGLQVPVAEFISANNYYILDNSAQPVSKWESDSDFLHVMDFVSRMDIYSGSTKTVEQVAIEANISQRGLLLLNSIIGDSNGTSIDQLGIGILAEELKFNTVDNIDLGLKSNSMQGVIISRFHGALPSVTMDTKIVSVDYSGSSINLLSDNGENFNADIVVSTVPISILKEKKISFTPELPPKFWSALSKFEMGAAIRVVLEFAVNFWGDEVPYILGSQNFPKYFSPGVNRGELNRTLSTTVFGSKAELYSNSGTDIVNEIIKDLDNRYKGLGTRYVRRNKNTLDINYIMEDWSKNPNILGAFSYPLAGATTENRKTIGEPIKDKLFFAGEVTDTSGWAGKLNGALASAERASAEVLEAIKKLS